MKLILFGGAERGEVAKELKQIEGVMRRLKPKQIFHIPFARTKTTEVEWRAGWYGRHIHIPGLKYLNAKNKGDIKKLEDPLVFISGGSNSMNLIKKLRSSPRLLKLIENADYIIGESAGAKVLGTYFRTKRADEKSPIVKGLNLIKNTVVEPHYTQRKRQKLLLDDMRQTGVRYGLGVDSCTAIEFELDQFPRRYKKIGSRKIKIIKKT